MICVSFVSVICVMVNKLILMNSIEWTPCVSAVSCKYLLQYEGKLLFANPLIHDWLWISRTSLCEAVCLRSEVRYRADATAIVVLSWAMLAEGIGSIFIGDNMEPDRLALWMQVCHFGYYSYIYPLRRQKPHAEYWNVPQLIPQSTRHYQPFSNKPLSGNATGGKHGSRAGHAIALFGDFYRQRVDLAGWNRTSHETRWISITGVGCFTPLQIYMYNRYIYIYIVCIYESIVTNLVSTWIDMSSTRHTNISIRYPNISIRLVGINIQPLWKQRPLGAPRSLQCLAHASPSRWASRGKEKPWKPLT